MTSRWETSCSSAVTDMIVLCSLVHWLAICRSAMLSWIWSSLWRQLDTMPTRAPILSSPRQRAVVSSPRSAADFARGSVDGSSSTEPLAICATTPTDRRRNHLEVSSTSRLSRTCLLITWDERGVQRRSSRSVSRLTTVLSTWWHRVPRPCASGSTLYSLAPRDTASLRDIYNVLIQSFLICTQTL